ncbi:MAG TPA: PKD domain-containing protein, partial [Anaerolineales bacterium]|nr:PKD domain-containing protein [Anaerolineales bacterium]
YTYTSGAETRQPASYTLSLTLTDDDTGQDTATIQANNAPTINSLSATTPINENGTTTLSGTLSDLDPQDTFTLLVDWGDGHVLTTTYPAGAAIFSHPHTSLDDNPTNPYTITVTLMDNHSGTNTAVTTLTVNNAAPTVDAGPDQTANDGTLLTFTGVFTDPGTLDTHTILWDFGDGITVTGTLAATHLYAGPGLYTVTLTITDDDGGVTQDTLQVTIQAVENPEYRIYLPLVTH